MPCEAIKIKYCLSQTCINLIGTFPSAMISGMELGELYPSKYYTVLSVNECIPVYYCNLNNKR